MQLNGINANVYVLSLARQKDGCSSSTFTAVDIIHYSKLKNQGIDLFEYAKHSASPLQLPEEKESNTIQNLFFSSMQKFFVKEEKSTPFKIYTFDTLPAMMLKLAQDGYPTEKGKEIVSVKREETLEQNIERYSSYTSKKWNCHADFKFTKYITLLVLNALENFEKNRA